MINTLLYQILTFTINGQILKSYLKIMNLKHWLRHRIKSLNYQMDHILYQIFKTILILSSNETATDNSSIRICVKTIENRITFKIKT